MYLNKIAEVIKNDYPLIKNLKLYGFYYQLSEDELNYVFSGIFGKPVRLNNNEIYDKNRNLIYSEDFEGEWYKREYDENGNLIYYEDGDGYWEKYEYDENGRNIYYEHSDGYWYKYEYDENGNQIYSENSDGLIRDYR